MYEINPFLGTRGYRARLADGHTVGSGDPVHEEDIDLTETVFAYGRRSPLWTPYVAPVEDENSDEYLGTLNKDELQTTAAGLGLATGGNKSEIKARILGNEPSAD